MELSDAEQLSWIVVNLTTSGKQGFDKPNLKKLKSMCKKSELALEETFRLIYSQLEKDHSEIRLAAVLLIDEFFQRSHLFRTLLLEQFDEFLELAAGTNFDTPLPEPNAIAQDLMKTTVKCVYNWHSKFGIAYKRLSLGYNFLRGTKKIRLINADEVQTEIQRNAAEYLRRKNEEQKKQKLDKLVSEIKLDEGDIKVCLAELDACIRLLVPKFTDDDDDEVVNIQMKTDTEKARASGIISQDYNIVLDIPQHVVNFVKIQRSNDNEVILENLHDRQTIMINSYLPKVKNWVRQLSVYEAESETLKKLLDIKVAMQNCLSKADDLVIQKERDDAPSTSRVKSVVDQVSSDCESSDDDFVEVPENLVVSPQQISPQTSKRTELLTDFQSESPDVNFWKPIRDDDNLNDPASYSRALAEQRKVLKSSGGSMAVHVKVNPKKQKNGHSGSGNSKIKVDAPVVPFGQDLLEWDDLKKNELKETLSLGMARELDIGHRFWSRDTASKGEQVSEAAISALTSRSIAFVGTFQPVNHTCRAPLPNGKLCPRMDRLKCPFHGVIIPRDAKGQPIDPADTKEESKRLAAASKNPEWQDPELLKELQLATGVDLKMPTERRKKTKKSSNLTDVKNLKNTSRYRLQRKVLNPKSMKRVSETLDSLDAKRNFQKFGNNFNYALN